MFIFTSADGGWRFVEKNSAYRLILLKLFSYLCEEIPIDTIPICVHHILPLTNHHSATLRLTRKHFCAGSRRRREFHPSRLCQRLRRMSINNRSRNLSRRSHKRLRLNRALLQRVHPELLRMQRSG